jgi:hypothetical protein
MSIRRTALLLAVAMMLALLLPAKFIQAGSAFIQTSHTEPCLLCGGTSAFIEMQQGELAASLAANPLVFTAYSAALLVLLFEFSSILFKRLFKRSWQHSPRFGASSR